MWYVDTDYLPTPHGMGEIHMEGRRGGGGEERKEGGGGGNSCLSITIQALSTTHPVFRVSESKVNQL